MHEGGPLSLRGVNAKVTTRSTRTLNASGPHRWAAPRPPVSALALASVGALAASIPLVYLLVRSFERGVPAFIESVFTPRVGQLTLNTVALTLAVTLTSLVLGVAVATVLARIKLPGGLAWLVIAALPLAVPSYLAAYGWLVFFPSMNGFAASWMVLTMVSVPYVILPVVAVLRSSSGELEAVARTLGRGVWGAFWAATWPTVRPAAAAGSLLVALYTLSDFGAVAMLRFQTLTWGIKTAYGASFDRNQAATLATVLVVLALVVVFGERRARSSAALQVGRRVEPAPVRARWMPVIVALLALSPVLGAVVPLAGMVQQLLRAETLQRLDVADLLSTAGVTLLMAVAAAVFAVLLALPIASLAAKYRGPVVNAIESLGYLGHALPGIVVGLSLVFFSLSVVPALYQTALMLVFAYVVLFLSKAIASSRNGLASVPQGLTDVARTQGLTPTQTWWRVSWRLAAPSVGVGALLVAIAVMKELPATLLLRPTGVNTLAVELWNRTAVLEFGGAAPYAAALVVLAAVPAFLLTGVRGVAEQPLRGGSE